MLRLWLHLHHPQLKVTSTSHLQRKNTSRRPARECRAYCFALHAQRLRRYRRVVERARAFECALQGDGEDDGVVVQFELPAGCYATSFLFEMCAGGAP